MFNFIIVLGWLVNILNVFCLYSLLKQWPKSRQGIVIRPFHLGIIGTKSSSWTYPSWVRDNIYDKDKQLIGFVYKNGNVLIGFDYKNNNTPIGSVIKTVTYKY
jgi:hypothetical protein